MATITYPELPRISIRMNETGRRGYVEWMEISRPGNTPPVIIPNPDPEDLVLIKVGSTKAMVITGGIDRYGNVICIGEDNVPITFSAHDLDLIEYVQYQRRSARPAHATDGSGAGGSTNTQQGNQQGLWPGTSIKL